MKKSIIAMAVAGALAVPAIASADATLYGSLRATMEKTDNQKVDTNNRGSRLGVMGNVDLGLEDTVGIYKVEFRFDPIGSGTGTNVETSNNVTRGGTSYLGAKGSWGTALVGVLDHPTEAIDLTTSIDAVGYDAALTTTYADDAVTNTLAYVSPSMSGFQVVAGVVVAGGTSDNSNIDGYQLGANFTGVENLNLSAAYGRISKDANLANGAVQDFNKWGVAADYTFDALNVAAQYTRVKDKDADVKETGYGIAGTYSLTDSMSVAANYTTTKVDNADRLKAVQLELANKMGRGVVAAGYVDRNGANSNGDDTIYVGYRLNF